MANKVEYEVEYAKSDRSTCYKCERGIGKGDLRVGRGTKSKLFDGMEVKWHHVKCCIKEVSSWEELRHWEYLRWNDQVELKKQYFNIISDGSPNEKLREKYLSALWDIKDDLEGSITAKGIKSICEFNKERVEKVSPLVLLHILADWVLLGRTERCPTCKNYQVKFNGVRYVCKGWITGYTKCDYTSDSHERKCFSLPGDLSKKDKTFFDAHKYPKNYPKETIKYLDPKEDENEEEEEEDEEEEEENEEENKDDNTQGSMNVDGDEDEPPVGQELFGMLISVAGGEKSLGTNTKDLKKRIQDHGGTVVEKDAHLMISCVEDVSAKKTKKINDAIQSIPIFPISWLNNLIDRTGKGIQLRKKEVSKEFLISPSTLHDDVELSEKYFKPKTTTTTTTTTQTKKKRTLEPEKKIVSKNKPKPGSDILRVDEDVPEPDAIVHVTYDADYGYTACNIMLNMMNLEDGSNKYYKIQVVKYQQRKFGVLLKWGRVGLFNKSIFNTHGSSESAALANMEERFKYFTGQEWVNRYKFEKLPHKYYMSSIDDGWDDDEDIKEAEQIFKKKIKVDEPNNTDSKKEILPARTQELIKLMFDPDMMNKQMKSMNLDLEAMPLGKIKKSQIMNGYKILTDIQDEIAKSKPSRPVLMDLSNKFYTLIPQSYGADSPPLIDTTQMIKDKMSLVEALIDIDVANSLKKLAEQQQQESAQDDPIMGYYKSLKTDIKPLDRDSDTFKTLRTYFNNSHDSKQFHFSPDVEDIFEVQREGENERFEDWKEDSNRQLLWHGSRLTNWCGIIGQGLRIAPKESPKTGYRFGKGIYFANCVSKSASYCFTSRENPKAIMILCEVALGTMNQLKQDEYMEKAPTGTHSTKALGMAHPKPSDDIKLETNLVVPQGKIIPSGLRTACTHDEFIVYDVAQVRVRYLFRINIKN